MGNRAIIAFEDQECTNVKEVRRAQQIGSIGGLDIKPTYTAKVQPFGVYLHWNGGPESVYAFLAVLNKRMEDRGNDISYAAARFVEIVGRYFGGNTSLGIHGFTIPEQNAMTNTNLRAKNISHGDNGIYVIAWDGKKYGVSKRFGADYGSSWLSELEIKHEEKAAYDSDYWTGEVMNKIVNQIEACNEFKKEEESVQ